MNQLLVQRQLVKMLNLLVWYMHKFLILKQATAANIKTANISGQLVEFN